MRRKFITFIYISIGLLIYWNCSTSSDPDPDPVNTNPTITDLTANPDTIGINELSELTCNASDPDGDELIFVWETDSGSISGSGSKVNWLSPETVGEYFVICIVMDGNGGYVVDSVKIVVKHKIPLNGLIAYYPFNGNANDESGNGNNGTVYGAILTTDRYGNTNSAYSFDGINDYINIGNNVKPPFPLTISTWVKINGFHGSTWRGIFRNDTWNSSAYYHGIAVTYDPSGGVAGGAGSGFASSNTRRQYYTESGVLNVGSWHNIIVIFNGANNMSIFVDSIEYTLTSTASSGTSMTYSSASGAIGRRDPDSDHTTNGVIDNIRIYNRALSEIEIQALFLE